MTVLVAERFVAGGDAIARDHDGRVVFVRGAIPGESVRVEVVQRTRDFSRAITVEVVEPSPDREAPPCLWRALGCGGCGWQHLSAPAQLAAKVDVLRDAFRRTGGLPDAIVEHGAAVEPWAHRTSMRLAVAPSRRLGLRAEASHDVVELGGCLVAHPRLAELVGRVQVERADELALRVSASTGERSAWCPPTAGRRRGRPARSSTPHISGLPGDVAVGPDASVVEVVAGRSLRVSAPSFFQSGPQAAELLVAAVDRAIGDADAATALDAYGGVGLFATTSLAGVGRVIVVEVSASACADARLNCDRAGVDAEVVESTLEAWHPEPVDLVVADPARAGLGPAGVQRLAATGASTLVLVSCDPVSAARDARSLAGAGYRHVRSEVLDLFPHTPHMEVVTRFDRV